MIVDQIYSVYTREHEQEPDRRWGGGSTESTIEIYMFSSVEALDSESESDAENRD